MNPLHLLSLISIIIHSAHSKCNHYYQRAGPSSTKRPFDLCYHSQVDENGVKSSHRYYCEPSTPEEYGNNSVSGYTAFREDFQDIDCNGTPNRTRVVWEPYRIYCEKQSPDCEILRLRQYPVINASACIYNRSIFVEDIEVIAICDDNGGDSKATFCNKKGQNDGHGSYFWTNTYYNGQCDSNRLFEAAYQFHGCQGDGATYLEILQCDFNYGGIKKDVEPFDDSMFVAGFVLLLVAILCIICILVWYCCWYRTGFKSSNDEARGHHERARSTNLAEDDEDEFEDGDERRTAMR